MARFVKTRGRAAALVEEGRVRLGGARVLAPDRRVRPGDVLTLALPHGTFVVRVRAAAERRGGAPDARELYEEVGEEGGEA